MHVWMYVLLTNAIKMHDKEYLLKKQVNKKDRLRGPSTGKGRNKIGVLYKVLFAYFISFLFSLLMMRIRKK